VKRRKRSGRVGTRKKAWGLSEDAARAEKEVAV
jgi:hypothetical protein